VPHPPGASRVLKAKLSARVGAPSVQSAEVARPAVASEAVAPEATDPAAAPDFFIADGDSARATFSAHPASG